MARKTFENLEEFILKGMRMSHIYQPVMLIALLKGSGKSKVRDIAKNFLQYDLSQIEYYEQITKNMPGRVLSKNHGLVIKHIDEYELIDFNELSKSEVKELISMCQARLKEYIDRYGEKVFAHRGKSSGYISGTDKYEVLKRAQFHCELCGISAKEKALQVDHIIPKNNGGLDDISNYQALCYSCNAMKKDRDDTDFRKLIASYKHRDPSCAFCNFKESDYMDIEGLAFAVRDRYPVTKLHTLIVPKRHNSSYFKLGRPEVNACNQLLQRQKEEIQKMDSTVVGFNIGINDGGSAGQTIFHCHIHLIPRRHGDIDDPSGGVRGVIPNMQKY